jgi:hypothetical protein
VLCCCVALRRGANQDECVNLAPQVRGHTRRANRGAQGYLPSLWREGIAVAAWRGLMEKWGCLSSMRTTGCPAGARGRDALVLAKHHHYAPELTPPPLPPDPSFSFLLLVVIRT